MIAQFITEEKLVYVSKLINKEIQKILAKDDNVQKTLQSVKGLNVSFELKELPKPLMLYLSENEINFSFEDYASTNVVKVAGELDGYLSFIFSRNKRVALERGFVQVAGNIPLLILMIRMVEGLDLAWEKLLGQLVGEELQALATSYLLGVKQKVEKQEGEQAKTLSKLDYSEFKISNAQPMRKQIMECKERLEQLQGEFLDIYGEVVYFAEQRLINDLKY